MITREVKNKIITFIEEKFLKQEKVQRDIITLGQLLKTHLSSGLQPMQIFLLIDFKKERWDEGMKVILSEIKGKIQLGMSVREALASCLSEKRNKSSLKNFYLLLSSLYIGIMCGGNIIYIIEKCLNKIERSLRLERKIKVATAQIRLQAIVISFVPLVVGMIVFLFSPDNILFFFQNSLGKTILFFMIILNILGFYFLHSLGRFEKIASQGSILSWQIAADFLENLLLHLEAGFNFYKSFQLVTIHIPKSSLQRCCLHVLFRIEAGESPTEALRNTNSQSK